MFALPQPADRTRIVQCVRDRAPDNIAALLLLISFSILGVCVTAPSAKAELSTTTLPLPVELPTLFAGVGLVVLLGTTGLVGYLFYRTHIEYTTCDQLSETLCQNYAAAVIYGPGNMFMASLMFYFAL